MKEFTGFPARMQYTAIPNVFLNIVLPDIQDIAELKTTLYIFEMLYRKKGSLRFTTYNELLDQVGLIRSLKTSGDMSLETNLKTALENAVKRGTILRLPVDRGKSSDDVYFLNTEANKQVVNKIISGEIVLEGLQTTARPVASRSVEPSDIFSIYEQNIGMLSPLIIEELRDAGNLYPAEWIGDAIREAVSLNKRSWRYITRILERWAAEGKDSGTHQRDIKKKTDPDKYIKGKYGHMVRR
jgi:DNA replication protein